MTNKKFKLAAMSLALTACVAASPLAANAESADAGAEPPVAAVSGEHTPTTNETKQESTDETKQNPVDETKQNPVDETKQNPADETKQNPVDETKQNPVDETKQNPVDETKQNPVDETKQNPVDETKQNPVDETKQNPVDETKQNPVDETKQNPVDETKQNPVDETKQEATDKAKQDTANESKQDTANESKQESTDESKQDTANESKQNPADETKQEATDKAKQDAAVENNDPAAAAPVAKAPMRMAASLAAPAAPTAPAEDDTVATITNQEDGTTAQYKSFDEAVKEAKSGDTIEVVKDATSTGIDLRDKNLTIKGKTVTTTTDSGTEENKPKLKFVAKEGQSQIAGITLWGSDLTFQNMDVDMTGASSTTYNKWNAVCMSDNAALTLNKTKLSMDGTGLDASAQGIYMAGRGRSVLNVNDHSTLAINNYCNAIAWDGVADNNEGSTYFINITDGSTFKAEGNGAGIVGLESLDVLVDNSTLTITDCTERSGINGADVKIVNGSTANISGNHEGYGIHANDLLVENSTLTANNNGYGGIRITGNGEFTNSTVTVTGTENKGNASVEITVNKNEHKDKDKYLVGSLSVQNSTLNISDNKATGIACRNRFSCPTSLTIDNASRVTIQNNNATPKNGYNPKGDSTGGGLRIEDGSTAVLGRNTVINNNTAKNGGGIYTKGGKVTIDNSTITENKATGYGGGICAEDNSTVTIDGGKVIGNTATNGNGGGIYAINGTVTATGSDISGNTAKTQGGGFHLIKSTLTASGNTIKNNSSQAGGGLYLDSTNAELTGNTIDSNKVIGAGGGMYTYGDASNIGNNTIALKGNTITNNTASSSGGGLAFANRNQHVTLDGDIIENNDGGVYGGGIHFASADLTMNGGSVSANNARNGGGIYHAIYGKTVTLNDVKIQDNTATKRGGGIFLWDSKGKLVLGSGTLVSCNKAELEGGGIYGGVKSTVDLRTGSVYNNHAGTAGDDIYLKEKTGSTLILRPVGDDWILDDCGHPIDGWYIDGKDARWDADSQKKFVTNLDALLEGTDYEIEKGEDGSYIITIGSNALALKAAHDAPSEPKPDPDGSDPDPDPKPNPKPGPDTPITPEDPQLPPVQDARADTPDSPVLPANPTNPAVQDAHALPQTGTSLFAALAMALSGIALTIAGAWASLLGKNSRH